MFIVLISFLVETLVVVVEKLVLEDKIKKEITHGVESITK